MDPPPADDLEHVRDYLQQHSPSPSQRIVLEVYETIQSLKSMPRRGRVGRVTGTRELVLTGLPYIAVYRLKDQFVEVLHIYPGAQEQPRSDPSPEPNAERE